MLERYLLSTLASKFGHVFEDFDEHTKAELSAWRGVLALRNLHLRKDALKHLGVPLAKGDDGVVDDDDFGDDGSDDENDEPALGCSAPNIDACEDGEASDDDSFLSCASHMVDNDDFGPSSSYRLSEGKGDEDVQEIPPSTSSIPSHNDSRNSPTIEIVHGSIGSLELHIPWGLLRAAKTAAAENDGNDEKLGEESKPGEKDDGLRCSAVLSDVRILLAAKNHTRNQSQFGYGSMNRKQFHPKQEDAKRSPSKDSKRILKELERMRKERELAVQSLLEAELFRLVRVMKGDGSEPTDDADDVVDGNSGDNDTANSGSNDEAANESWLSRWAKGLVARILSSLQVTIQNIHIRYEDEGHGWFEEGAASESHKRRRYRPAFAVGMRLGNFSVRSANADEEMPDGSLDDGTSSTPETAQLRRKIANVEKLSVYWDSSHPDLFVGYKTQEEDRVYYEKRFEELDIMSSDDFEGGDRQHSYLIQPISPSLQLMVIDLEDESTGGTTPKPNPPLKNSPATPSIHASLCLPSCHVSFDRNTLEDVAYVRKCLSSYRARVISSKEWVIEQRISQQLTDLRPPMGVGPLDNPRLWWRYAFGAVRALQADRSYFEGRSDIKERKRRRDGWLGLARLLRLRNEYTSLYLSLWSSSQKDIDQKSKIHGELLSLEDLLNHQEISAFRIAVFSKLANSRKQEACAQDSAPQDVEDIRTTDSLDTDELALGSLSVLSLEYRETKLNQIVRSIDSDQRELNMIENNGQKSNATHPEPNMEIENGKNVVASMWVFSIACHDFTVQANETSQHANDTLHIITAQLERQQVVPIVSLQCLSSLRFEKFFNGSWDLSCALSSLTVSDLISPYIEKSGRGRTLIGKKEMDCSGSDENMNKMNLDEHTASIIIRNNVSGDKATTHFKVNVTPLEVIYSTNAFEALSRLFAAVKTTEFNRDYERITKALSHWRSRQGKRLATVLSRRRKNFTVSISIAAPVLFIPEDLQHADSPTLVVDLGRLTFQSDSSESPPVGFDDKWLLNFNNLQLSTQKSSVCKHAIIEPFSLKFSISTHIAEGETSATDVTKIDIQALLPQLSFNLTSSAVRLVSRLQIRWNDAKLRNPQVPQRQTLDEFLLANRGPSRHHTILGTFSKGEFSGQDEAPQDVVIAKQEIKFLFSAPTIALQIGNDVGLGESTSQSAVSFIPLINLSIRGIRGNFLSHFSQEGSSSQFSARLRSIHARDIQKAGSHFCHFLSSMDPGLLQNCVSIPIMDSFNDGDDDLVVVETSKESNGDQAISIHFHELYVEWNPELLATIQKSLRLPPSQNSTSTTSSMSSDENITNQTSNESEFFDALDDTDTNITIENSVRAGPNVTNDVRDKAVEYQAPSMTEKTSPQFKIRFHLSKLRVNFNKDSQFRCLFVAEMNQTDIAFCQKTMGGSIATATVANARLKDPDGATGGSLYGQMIGLQSGGFSSSSAQTSSIVKMSFERFPNCDESEFHNLMKVEFSEMKFVYIHQLWLEIFDYFFEGISGHAVWGTIPKPSAHFFNPSEATRAFKRTRFSIKMNAPLILLPLCYRSPQHIRLKMKALTITNHFTKEQIQRKEGNVTDWIQWFNAAKLDLRELDVRSWDGRKLNEASDDMGPPSMTLNIRWPVGPTAPLVKPKWNVVGTIDPIVLCLSRKDFSLFRFFVSYNLLEPSRFISKQNGARERLVLFGYEKTGLPPTTYSLKLSTHSLEFQFLLDEEESQSRKIERLMNVNCSNASWAMVKNPDCISKQRANVESIRLTSDKEEWGGFPDLLLPLPASIDAPPRSPHCLLQFTSTTHPNGNNVKTLHLDAAGIYLIVPAWQYVGDFFTYLPTSPEVFAPEEMSSIMQIGDRFYRMSKSSVRAKNNADDVSPEVQSTAPQVSMSKQFLLTLTSPRIILVADATTSDSPCVTLSMANMNFLREAKNNCDEEHSVHSVFCDGLEIFTGMAQNLTPCSSLLCPFSLSGSLRKVTRSKSSPQKLGWVWVNELEAIAAYTDLVHAIDVFNGVKKQIYTNQRPKSKSTAVENDSSKTNEDKSAGYQSSISIDFLCDGMGLVVTDDSHRQFANAQPLVSLSLFGLRFSHVATDTNPSQGSRAAQSSASTQSLGLIKNTFVSLDSLELTDLLRHGDSPFRVMATSSHSENSKHGLFSFTSQIELVAMSWQSHKILALEWGFQMSPSMKQRHSAIHQLTSPSRYFDPSERHEHFVAFHSIVYESGLNCIDFNVQHLTAQWNPSTIIALQRFLGRLKKAAISILSKTTANKNSASNSNMGQPPTKEPAESCHVIFSVKARIESVCICLNKEYQQRRLLDALVTGVKIQFERYNDSSLLLQGSIVRVRVWDPDMSKATSDRNRHMLGLTEDVDGTRQSNPFFSFHYKTFRALHNKCKGNFCLPDWVQNKISSGDIDDFLMLKMKPVEFNYLSERTAELADYLNNGLPGKGLGHTSKAAQSFCASRIRTRSFLDLVLDQPRVFIPRSPSSLVGGCYLSLGTVSVTSWFEEGYTTAHDRNPSNISLGGTDSPLLSSEDDESWDKMDWWRVLDIRLGVGIQIEVNQAISEGMFDPDTFFHASLTVRKPSSGKTMIIQGNVPSVNIQLKYREFIMLNLISHENIGKPVNSEQWENVEKSYWQSKGVSLADSSNDQHVSSLVYAESARFVRFGETKADGNSVRFGFAVDSINVTLHRDDWYENLDEENAALLCYDICNFSIHKMLVAIVKRPNGDRTTSIALFDMSFTDVGDYGRLARDVYLSSNDPKRPPCAFSVVAEGYGESSEDPLVSLVIGTQSSHPTDDGDGSRERKKVVKNIELKVNSLSITVLPRSIDDVLCFLSKKWTCPNSNLEINGAPSSPNSLKNDAEVSASATETLQFKFVAIYPRLILLADESNPFSRALVLRGLAVGNMSNIQEASLISRYGEVDVRSSTILNGHVKELETYVHNNIDMMIGPNRTESENNALGVTLIEPVTVTLEVKMESRSRFPTSRFVSMEIEPVAMSLSFGDLNLIETVVRKSARKKKDKSRKESRRTKIEREPQLSPMATQVDSLQFSKSSDYSECDEGLLTIDVVMLTKKLGLKLRISGSSVIVESSITNPNVESGDILVSINGTSVERMPLQSIVDIFEKTPRPLTITVLRLRQPSISELGSLRHQSLDVNGSDVVNSNSTSFDMNFSPFESPTSENGGVNDEQQDTLRTSQVGNSSRRFDLICECGKPNGLEIMAGLGGAAVLNNVDYENFAGAISSTNALDEDKASKRLPLPGAILFAVDGEEINGKNLTFEEVTRQLVSNETSASEKSYTLSFVEADSSSWGNITNFEGKLSFRLTIIDDSNGRDMPVLRAGLKETSFVANHGLALATKTIFARRPFLLSFDQNEGTDSSAVLTLESNISSFSLEYYHQCINVWEPIIEPHSLIASIERQGASGGSQPGQCSIAICDNEDRSSSDPTDFICINVSDSAVDILSKAAMNWRLWKSPKSQTSGMNEKQVMSPPESPRQTTSSPVFGKRRSASSAADLKRATKLAKLALDFQRKRGKASKTDATNSPFVFRNRSGLMLSFSARGISITVVRDGNEAQFQMSPVNDSEKSQRPTGTRFRKYDGRQFPTLDIELNFDVLGTTCPVVDNAVQDVYADTILDLPTDKVGRTVRSVCLWKKKKKKLDDLMSQQINVVWTVELEENRRVLTLSSATKVEIWGCSPAIEVGVRCSEDVDEIAMIGTTSKNNVFHLPVWVESCFCEIDVYIRPSTPPMDSKEETAVYKWSTFPVLSLKELSWNADAIEVQYNWVTDMAPALGGVSCPLNTMEEQDAYHPVWLQCTYSKDFLKRNRLGDKHTGPGTTTTVTIWSAMTIRNMLPCTIEWEVASRVQQDGTNAIFDSSSKRDQQRRLHGMSTSSGHSHLQCGSAVEVFTSDALDREVHARFKCIVRNVCYWSEWLSIGLTSGTMKKTFGKHTIGAKQINIQCRIGSCESPLTIGVKLSSRAPNAGQGVNLILYAEIWLRNLTSLPLTFGAPSLQIGSDGDLESSLLGKVSADSALIELTSVLEGNSFGLFGNTDDDDDDLGGDILNLPLQQCEEVFEEVFEYVSLNEKGDVQRRWWASENHVSLRQEPKMSHESDGNTVKENERKKEGTIGEEENSGPWLVDCAGMPLLQNGWETCANLAGSKSFTFNGRRLFNKSHRFRRRRLFRKLKMTERGDDRLSAISDRVIFHQPADLDRSTRSRREAERNAIGAHLDEKKEGNPNLFDVFNRTDVGVLDIMSSIANDGSIVLHAKHKDGKFSSPAIIPPSGNSNGVIRACSSRWPTVTKAIKEQKQKGAHATWDECDQDNVSIAPLEPTVFELVYQVTALSGLWGELSRMVTITPRFLIRNESSWFDIDVKQVGSPDTSRVQIKKDEMLPFYWFDISLPELVCARPTQSRNRFRWSGGFDMCTLGMIPLRVRRTDGSIDNLNLRSLRVNVELQPGTVGSGTIISIRDEDPHGEGSLFRIENHSPFDLFVAQDGVLANPASVLLRNDSSLSCDRIQPGERTSYALDVPWRQGKYAGRTSASMSELLLLRCALAPLSTRDGVESTKVVCFDRVGDSIRLSPSRLTSIGSHVATGLLGVRVAGVVGTDGPTRTLRFILMQKEVTTTGYIGNAMRDTISPMPSFMTGEPAPHVDDDDSRTKALLDAAANAAQLLNAGNLPDETEATKQAFFGTGICKRPPLEMKDKPHTNLHEDNNDAGDDITCELSCSGFVFSIIDSSPTELAVISLHGVRAGATWNSLRNDYARSRILVGWFQLDNHCPGSVYPVALRPRLKVDGSWKDEEGSNVENAKKPFTADKPFLELKVDFAPRHRTGIQSLSAGASLHDVEIFLDLAFILRMQHWWLGIQNHIIYASGNSASVFVDSQETWNLPSIDHLIKRKTGQTITHQSMYFHRLTILPCNVTLSVAPVRALARHQEEFEGEEASAIHAAVRKGDLLVGEGSGVLGVKIGSKNQTAISVVQGMLKSILVDALLRCDGASLNFEGVALFNHTSNGPQLVTYLGAHYLASLIANVPALIGSLAAFGNPLGLIRDLGDGVSDFVNEPVKGIRRSLEEMDPSFALSGVARGTGSLARRTVGGFADSAAMLTETAAKNMAVLTLDRRYAQRRDRVMKLKANDAKAAATILQGLESGVQKFVHGVLEGVTGVVSKPIRGAERSGFEGFAKGVGKGLLGLVMKPVIGTTDLLTDTLIGVKGSVEGVYSEGVLTLHSQVRPRRALYGRDRVVKPYRIDDATAATIQSKLCIGGEEYFSHVDMVKNVALMSVRRLLILSGDGEELFLIPYSDIRKIEMQPQIEPPEGFVVRIFLHETKANGSDYEEVKCDEENMANLLCEKLTEVISNAL